MKTLATSHPTTWDLVTPDGGLEHYDGKIRIMDKNGKVAAECVDPTKYRDFIGEAVEP